MGHLTDLGFESAYLGDQIDLLLAAMAQANPLPSGTDWVAFIDDCRAAQTAAESAQTAAEAAAAAAQTWSSNPPYIDPTTGDWLVYNTQTQQFVNSGVHAQGPKGDTGATGAAGADGVSPGVSFTPLPNGSRMTVTDAAHPGGQSVDILNGNGAGDMVSSTYDPQGAVAADGGIPAYVANHAPAGGVTSFNSRTGAVTPTAGDYTAPMVGAAGQAQIAGVESSTTASQAYAIGAYFVYNGTLYRATAAIAQGDTITPGTNCTATNVGGELEGKQDATNYSAAQMNQYLAMVAAANAVANGGVAPGGFGLGDINPPLIDTVEKLDSIIRSGFYRYQGPSFVPHITGTVWASIFAKSATGHYITFDAYIGYVPSASAPYSNLHLKRTMSGENVYDSGWEYVNPPLAKNTEYRTTERFNGKPVYAKSLTAQTLAATGTTAFPHGISNLENIISVEGYAGLSPLAHYPGITGISADATNLNIITSGATAVSAAPIIKYTKTTN